MVVKIHVKCKNVEKITLEIDEDSTTIRSVKEQLADRVKMAPEEQRLICRGKILQDDKTLKNHGIKSILLHS